MTAQQLLDLTQVILQVFELLLGREGFGHGW
jgi:hypothetical protein